MNVRATVSAVLTSLLLLAACTSDASKAREALARGKQLAQRSPDEAATHFADAARLDPTLHEAFARLARLRLEQHRGTDAETPALRAASLVPRSSYYSELLGRAQLAAQKPDGAAASLGQAITLDPRQTARLAFDIGVVREAQSKLVEAQASYERAAAADANAVPPRLALARLYLHAQRLDDAKRKLDEARAHVSPDGSERVLFARLDGQVEALVAQRAAAQAATLGGTSDERAARAAAMTRGILRLLGSIDDAGSATDSLFGDQIGDSFGFGGLGLSGVGAGGGFGGGGTGEGSIGLGSLGTIGRGAGPGGGTGYGMGVGGLGRSAPPATQTAPTTPATPRPPRAPRTPYPE